MHHHAEMFRGGSLQQPRLPAHSARQALVISRQSEAQETASIVLCVRMHLLRARQQAEWLLWERQCPETMRLPAPQQGPQCFRSAVWWACHALPPDLAAVLLLLALSPPHLPA